VKADIIVLLEIPVLWEKWSVLVCWYFAELTAVELLLRRLKELGVNFFKIPLLLAFGMQLEGRLRFNYFQSILVQSVKESRPVLDKNML
jgi:hypothetical protein